MGEDNDGILPRAYDDLLHPAAKQLGETVGRAIGLSLSPVNGLLWTGEKALEWAQKAATSRLFQGGLAPGQIVVPPPSLVGAVIVGIQATAGDETLNGLFANLLASSMDAATTRLAHPAYAQIIRQMVPDEAKLLGVFDDNTHRPTRWVLRISAPGSKPSVAVPGLDKFVEHASLLDVYVSNLTRLGVLSPVMYKSRTQLREPLTQLMEGIQLQVGPTTESSDAVMALLAPWSATFQTRGVPVDPTFELTYLERTDLGKFFMQACYR